MPFIIGVAGSVAVGQVDHLAHPAGAAAALADLAQGRPRHHRRLPLLQRRARRARHHGRARAFPRATIAPRFVQFLVRHQVGQARRQGAGLFAPRLRRDAGRVQSPSTGPTSSSSRGSTSCSRANCRSPASRILFASDFIDFSIYHRRRRGRPARLVHGALPAPARNRLRRPASSFFHRFSRDERRGGRRLRPLGLGRTSTCPTCATTSCRRAAAPT